MLAAKTTRGTRRGRNTPPGELSTARGQKSAAFEIACSAGTLIDLSLMLSLSEVKEALPCVVGLSVAHRGMVR
jgi:hypothetical protein